MPRRSGAPGGIPRVVWSITALHVLVLVLYSMLFAPFRPPDEPEHVDLVRAVRRDASYPRWDGRNLSEPVVNALPLVRFDVPAVRSRDLSEDAAPSRAERPPFRALGDDDVTVDGEPNQLPSHPPLYYGIGAGVQTVAAAVIPGSSGWSFDQEIAVLRLFSVLLLAPLPVLAFAIARRLRWSMPVAVGAAIIPIAIPQLSHIGSSVTNDNLLTLLVGIATLLVIRVATDDRSWPTALGLGVVAGLAMLTKAFALFLPVWMVIAMLVAVRNGVARRPALLRLAASLAVAFVVGGWWWLRNILVFGKLQTGIKLLAPAPESFEPDTGWWLGRYVSFIPQRFWGWFGWFDVRLPTTVTAVASAAVLIGVVGAALAMRRRDTRQAIALLLAPTIAIAAMVFLGAYQGYRRTGFDEGLQGRYLFPGVIGLGAVVAFGLARLLGRRARHVPLVVFASAVLMQLIGVGVILGFYWGGSNVIEQFQSMAAWSPWPAVVPALVLVGVLATAGATGAELWRLDRRRSRLTDADRLAA